MKARKILSLLLAVAMVFTLLPMPVHAEEAAPETLPAAVPAAAEEPTQALEPEAIPERERFSATIPYQVNPLYEGLYTPDPADIPQFPQRPDFAPQAASYQSVEEAAKLVRTNMKNRTETYTVYVKADTSNYNEVYADLLNLAVEHTGVGTEGDYLLWHLSGYGADLDYYRENGTYYYTYYMTTTFYTTAEQETELTAAVNNLINSLGVKNKSDYEKICAVYDYICANITYDYANLEDESYKLKFSAYAALVNKTAVCQGYALLFYRLMLELGVDTRFIGGDGGGPHAWNIVQLGDYYYNLDATWDAGVTDYAFFLQSTWNFVGHYRDPEFDTWDFHMDHPMAGEDYVHGGTATLDPYINMGYCGNEDMEYLNAAWAMMRDGTLVIEGEGAMHNYTPASLPYYYYWIDHIEKAEIGEGITRVGNYAFYEATALKEISLPESLTQIGYDAFSRSGLESVEIPGGVATVDSFDYCENLKKVVLNEGTALIDREAFRGCSALEEVTFPSSLRTINWYAFTDAVFTKLNLPEGLTTIDRDAFWGCNELVEVSIPSTVTNLSGFSHCEKLAVVHLAEGLKGIGGQAFGSCPSLTTVNFPSTLETIGNEAFYGCSALTDLDWPEGLTSIGASAFAGCRGLTQIDFPSTLRSLGASAFRGCTGLTELEFPEGMTGINESAFSSCTGLTKIKFPSTMEGIGKNAFSGCSALTELELPESLTYIGQNAFASCVGLTEITIPASVTDVNGFNGCTNLAQVTLPEGVQSIGYYAFNGCTSLATIDLPSTLETIDESAFASCTGLTELELPEGLSSIGTNAFAGCVGLTEITIPASVTSVNGFRVCTNLAQVNLSEGVQSISTYAFMGCTSLAAIDLPSTLTTINDYAFDGCSALAELELPEGFTTIGTYAFNNCTGLTTIHLPSTLETIGRQAFTYCTALTGLALPEGLQSIGDGAFAYCHGLTEITIPASVTTVLGFYDCINLKQVNLPEGLQEIGYQAFDGCTGLEKIEIPSTVTLLNMYAFRSCTGLKEVVFEGNAPEIRRHAFYEVTATAYYPANNSTWTDDVMQDYSGTITWEPYEPACAGHSYEAVVTEPTCTEQGYTTYTCANCGHSYVDNYTDPVDHVYEDGECIWCGEAEPNDNKCGDNAWWSFDHETGTLIISGEGEMYGYSGVTTPWAEYSNEITTLIVEEGITKIGKMTFEMLPNLTDVTLPNSVTFIGNFAFFSCASLESIALPETLTGLGQQAFDGCTSLKSVVIPASVTFVDAGVFGNCTSLTDVLFLADPDIPGFAIGNSVFRGCTALEEIRVEEGHMCLRSIDGALYIESGDGQLNLNDYPAGRQNAEFRVADNTVRIEQFSFENLPWLETVIIPDTVTFIGNFAFQFSQNLKNVKFEGSMPELGNGVFNQCNITISYPCDDETWDARGAWESQGVFGSRGSIAWAPDHACEAQVTEPTCTEQGYTTYTCVNCGHSYVDNYTDPVDHVYEDGKCQWCGEEEALPGGTWGDNITWELTFDGTLIVSGQGEVAENRDEPYPWKAYADQIVKVIFEEGVTNVPVSAFEYCYPNLVSAELKSVEVIGSTAFAQCTALTSVILPDTLAEIDNGAFTDTGLTTIEIPEGVTRIGLSAFSSSKLTQIVLPEGLVELGDSAFYGCEDLKSVYMPDSVTDAGLGVFGNCFSLETVNISKGLTFVNDMMFSGCPLKEIEIPEGITWLGMGCFQGAAITSVTIPASVTLISSSFQDCTELKEITFLGDAPSMGSYSFTNVTATAYYPAGNETWTEEIRESCGSNITWVAQGEEEEESTVRWLVATTSLNGTIDLNIYVVLSEDILNDPNAVVRFEHSGVTVEIPVSEGIPSKKGEYDCFRYSCEIYAKQVADTVTVQVVNENGAIGDPLDYSVMKYCVNQINKSDNEKQVAVCKAMLNYAAAAQTYFNYNTDNLANASLSEADKVLPEVDATDYKFSVVGSEPGIQARTATLMLESEVSIRIYFAVEAGYSIDDFTFTIDGEEVQATYNESKGWYYIESDGIPAKELENMHQFSVGGLTVNYGALSYVNSKVTSDKTEVNERNLAKALYAYYAAAEALLG